MVDTQILLKRSVSRHRTLHREHLLPDAWAEGNAVSTSRHLQRPERAGLIRIGVSIGQVARSTPILFDEHAAARQQLHQPGDHLVQQRLQLLVGGCGYFDKHRLAVGAPVHAVQHQAMQMSIEIGRRAKTLDQRDRAAVGLKGLEAGLIQHVARDHAVYHLQHWRHQHRLCGQQQSQRNRQ